MSSEGAKLVNLATGKDIAQLSEAQLQLLKSQLEAESPSDTNFLITPDTLVILREQGASELAELLSPALGNKDELTVGYAPISGSGPGRVQGRLLHLETGTPMTGYKVEAYDEDLVTDDLLGWSYTNPEGRFEIRFEESTFKDRGALGDLEGEPEIKLRIRDVEGEGIGVVGIIRALEASFGDVFLSTAGEVIAPVLDSSAEAICPKCGATYRAGFANCNDCQIPLRPLT